jgi:hypothetical protein
MIRWTQNTQAIDRRCSEEEILTAKVAAVEHQLRLRAHRALRQRVNQSLDAEEAHLGLLLKNALDRVVGKTRSSLARVGYDLEAGEVVLADAATGEELERRPLSDSDRRIAEKMPDPA